MCPFKEQGQFRRKTCLHILSEKAFLFLDLSSYSSRLFPFLKKRHTWSIEVYSTMSATVKKKYFWILQGNIYFWSLLAPAAVVAETSSTVAELSRNKLWNQKFMKYMFEDILFSNDLPLDKH